MRNLIFLLCLIPFVMYGQDTKVILPVPNKEEVKEKKKLDEKHESLDDQLILMKLIVTHRMIEKYQENERPNVSSIKKASENCDELIKKTKEIIK